MAEPRQVLVTCGGKWVGMVLQLRRAMREVPAFAGGELLVADRAELTPAGCFADRSFVVPPIADDAYHRRLLELCERHRVGALVPLIDLDLERLAPHGDAFAAVGTTLVCPPPALVELGFDKIRFAAFADEEGLPYPAHVPVERLEEADYPLFHKRRRGFGSIGIGRVEGPAEAKRALEATPELVFQRVVDATEFSVDAFLSRSGRATVRVMRERQKVVGGESQWTRTTHRPPVAALADRTLAALAHRGLTGPLNLQIFDAEPACLIEVNTRLGSASVLSNMATGGRLLRSVLTEAAGGAADGDPDDYRRGLSLYRFSGDVFHDGAEVAGIFPDGGG